MTSKQANAETEDPASSSLWGFNPDTRRYVKKSGKVWERLVKSGRSQDPELLQKLQVKALARKKATLAPAEHKVAPKPPSKSRAKRAAKIINSHRSELDALRATLLMNTSASCWQNVYLSRRLRLKPLSVLTRRSPNRYPGAAQT